MLKLKLPDDGTELGLWKGEWATGLLGLDSDEWRAFQRAASLSTLACEGTSVSSFFSGMMDRQGKLLPYSDAVGIIILNSRAARKMKRLLVE